MNAMKSAWTFLTMTTSPDRNEARNEYMLRAILVSMAAITVAGSIIGTFGALFGSVKYDTVMILAAMSVLFMTGWHITGRGHWRIARWVPVVLFLLAALYGIYLGGIGTPSLLLLAITVILAAMFFGMKGLGVTVFIVLLSFILLGELHYRGIVTAVRSDQSAYHNRVLIAVAALLAIGVFLRFLIRQMEKAIEVSQGHEEDLAAANEELQAAMEELEAANEEFEAANEELMRTNRELDESEYKYRGLVESISEVIFSTDAEGAVTYVSPAIESLIGHQPGEIVGKELFEYIHPEDVELVNEDYMAIIDGPTQSRDYRLVRKDGTFRWVRDFSSPVFREGQFAGINGIITDIHDMKLAEIELRRKQAELRESEERFRSMIQSATDMIFVLDGEGRFTYESPSVERILGYSAGYFIGRTPFDLIHPDDLDIVRKEMGDVYRSANSGLPTEFRLRRADGAWVPLEALASNLTDNEAVRGIVITARDVTERKRADEALREKESVMRGLLEATPAGVGMIRERRFVQVNAALCRMIGYTEEEMLGQLTRIIYKDDDDYERVGRELYGEMERTGLGVVEVQMRRKDGSLFDVLISLAPFDPADHSAGACATALDITERKRAVEALKLSELTYREIFNKIGETIWIHDIETLQFIDVNENATRMFGYSHDELMNLKLGDISSGVPPYYEENGVNLLKKAAAGESQHFEWHCRHKDGHFFWTEVSLKHGIIAGKECILAIEHDITKRKEAEEEIRNLNASLERKVQERTEELQRAYDDLVKSNDDLEAALRSLNDTQQQLVLSEKLAALGQLAAGIAHELNTPLGAIISSNRSMIDIIHNGLPALADLVAGLGKNDKLWFDSLLAESLDGAVQIDRSIDRKTRRDIRLQLQEAGAVDNRAFAETIADLGLHRYLREHPEPLKSERLGDILKGVSSLASLRRLGEIVAIAAEKASHVVGALRSYLRQDEPGDLSIVDLVKEIDIVLTLYQNKLKYGVDVKKRYEEGLFTLGNRNGLNQVWMNLLSNALHAMDYKGSLEIVAEKKEEWIVISVIDSGPGVAENIRERIFEPFFTTKKHGEGIGLGLDISRKIIDSLGGRIELVSSPGRTEFRVWLRRAAMPS